VDGEHKYVECELAIGEKIQIGEVIVTVVDTQDEEAAVIVEQHNETADVSVDDESEEQLARSRPR